MEYNVSGLLRNVEVDKYILSMEQKHTSTLKLWTPEDLELPKEAPTEPMFARRGCLIGGACLAIALIMSIIFVWQTMQVGQYQHVVQQNARWIAQQSARETTCFRQAATTAQRDACAQTASAVTANFQRQFGDVPVPLSQNAAANEMQSAFAALDAAACYNQTSHTADDTCLHGIASRLHIAVLDAHDAAQK